MIEEQKRLISSFRRMFSARRRCPSIEGLPQSLHNGFFMVSHSNSFSALNLTFSSLRKQLFWRPNWTFIWLRRFWNQNFTWCISKSSFSLNSCLSFTLGWSHLTKKLQKQRSIDKYYIYDRMFECSVLTPRALQLAEECDGR